MGAHPAPGLGPAEGVHSPGCPPPNAPRSSAMPADSLKHANLNKTKKGQTGLETGRSAGGLVQDVRKPSHEWGEPLPIQAASPIGSRRHGGWGRGPSRVCGLHGCATVLIRGHQHLWCWDGLSGALGRMRRRVAASVTKSDTRSRIRCANGAMCDRETGSRCEVSRADRNCKLCMVWI